MSKLKVQNVPNSQKERPMFENFFRKAAGFHGGSCHWEVPREIRLFWGTILPDKPYGFFTFCQTFGVKKSCMWETLNLLTFANSSTNTKIIRNRRTGKEAYFLRCQMSGVTCHVWGVTCQVPGVLRVTCHLSETATARATFPPPANYPIHNRMVANTKKNKTQKSIATTNVQKSLELCQYRHYAFQPEVSSPPGSGFSAMTQTTCTHHDLETESAQWANSVKKQRWCGSDLP